MNDTSNDVLHPSENVLKVKRLANGKVYIKIRKEDPHYAMTSNGWLYEHRYEMARKLGRNLTSDEEVLHKNHILNDNRLSNLILRKKNNQVKLTYTASFDSWKVRDKIVNYLNNKISNKVSVTIGGDSTLHSLTIESYYKTPFDTAKVILDALKYAFDEAIK